VVSARVRRRGRRVVVGSLVGVVLASALAWRGLWGVERSVELPGHLLVGSRSTDRGGSCSAGTADVEREVGGGTVVPARTVEVTGVRLVDPHNVELVDAVVLPRLQSKDQPVVAAPPPAWRSTYPTTPTWDWSQAVGTNGGRVNALSMREVLLHVRVADPGREASFSDIEVSYTSSGRQSSELLGQYWLTMADGVDCPADWYERFG